MFGRGGELGLGSECGPGKGRLGEEGELLAAATCALPWAVVKCLVAWYLQKIHPRSQHVANVPVTIAIIMEPVNPLHTCPHKN